MRKSRVLTAVLAISLLAWGGAAFAQGQLQFSPVSGPVGTVVQATATGLPPGASAALVWHTGAPEWVLAGESNEEFRGYVVKDRQVHLAHVQADSQGRVTFSFTIPEDFGWLHNVTLESNGEVLARQGFVVVKSMTVEPASGPVGTPIRIRVTGLGFRTYEAIYHLLYDNVYTGMVTALTTGGTAEFVIPATGEPGAHSIQILDGALTGPYLNIEQNPGYIPGSSDPLFATFTITEGEPVLPEPFQQQVLVPTRNVEGAAAPAGTAAGPSIAVSPEMGQVWDPVTITGSGFPANAEVELFWETVVGNRVGGQGWQTRTTSFARGVTDATGAFRIEAQIPDDLGGPHRITAVAGGVRAEGSLSITPSVVQFTPTELAPGEEFTLQFKGIGWTETENILTVVHDNAYIGYACGFNTQGDVTLYLRASVRPGWHFIDIYPAIYKGDLGGINIDPFRTPMLNAADHPGAELPVFRLAYYVRPN